MRSLGISTLTEDFITIKLLTKKRPEDIKAAEYIDAQDGAFVSSRMMGKTVSNL